MGFNAVAFLEGLYGATTDPAPGTCGASTCSALQPACAIGPDDLPGDWRIEWEERAAIREYDGGQVREHAEAEALREIVQRMRAAR